LSEADGRVTITVTGHAGNQDNTAVTVYVLAKRFDFITGSAAPGGTFTLSDLKVGRGNRIVVEMDLPTPVPGNISEAIVSVAQALGGGAFNRRVDFLDTDVGGVHRFVFDVE
jgi:hypothetical protein